MRLRYLITAWAACAGVSAGAAQPARDAGGVVRDLMTTQPRPAAMATQIATPAVPSSPEAASQSEGVLIGAVTVEGAPSVPREAFASAIADYLGKQALTRDLQALARSVASVARERGYVFASAVVPPQSVGAGMVTVRVDEGDIAAVRVRGSQSARLQRTLDLIVGRGVRREVLERQLLLAGDIPGIEIVTTKLVREDIGNVLQVEVRESRGNGFAGVDTYGARDLGPVRARLRYDFIGLGDDDDVLSVQVVATPVNPGELAYASARYAATIGTGGTQIAVTGALGRAQPSNSGFESRSTFVSVAVSTPLQRANAMSIWANAELGVLRVAGTYFGVPDQRDVMAVATGWLYATTRLGGGRLSGALGLARGLGLGGTTGPGGPAGVPPRRERRIFEGVFRADLVRPLGHGLSVKLAANGQLADRPLLAAQEIVLGGPAFGRAFDFSERFGDSGFMTSAELRWRRKQPTGWIDWIEPFAFVDSGRVWNLDGGYGSGDLTSAGGGIRAARGRLQLSVEAAVPVSTVRAATGSKSPRVNVSVGRRF